VTVLLEHFDLFDIKCSRGKPLGPLAKGAQGEMPWFLRPPYPVGGPAACYSWRSRDQGAKPSAVVLLHASS